MLLEEKFKNVKNSKWLKRYLKFIEVFQQNEMCKNIHKHHILPRSLYPEYECFNENSWNLVYLNYRSHLIAHYMLAKALGGNMWFAYNMMNAYGEKLNSLLYESAMIEIKKQQSLRQKQWLKNNNHPKGMLNKKHPKTFYIKLKETLKKRTIKEWNEITDKIHKTKIKNGTNVCSEKTKQLMSDIMTGHKVTDETKKKISNTRNIRIKEGKITFDVSKETSKKISDALKEKYMFESHHTKGKTYEEIMGFEKAKILKIEKSKNNPSKRQDVKDKISKGLKGKPKSESHKKTISELVWMNKNMKNKRSKPNEVDKWLSEGWKLGKVMLECPHCHRFFDQSNYKQWHGDKCKLNLK